MQEESTLTDEQMEIARDYIQNLLSYMTPLDDDLNTVEYVQAVADRVKDHIESELGSWEYVYAEAKAELFEYIKVFYNRERLHSSLGYQSPKEFEEVKNVA